MTTIIELSKKMGWPVPKEPVEKVDNFKKPVDKKEVKD
jgi:hypothetical protein